jgi:uncharacterized protein
MMSQPDARGTTSRVARLLVALVSVVCRHPRLILALSLLLCGLSIAAAVTRLEYHTQRNDLISARKECRQRWQRYITEFGDDDDIVAVVQGTNRERMRQAVDALADGLRGQPELFDRLFYHVDLRHLKNRALLLLPFEQIRSISRDCLGDMARLLESGPTAWHALGLLTLTQEANGRAKMILDRKTDEPLSDSDKRFFTQLRAIADSAHASLADPRAYRDPWVSIISAPEGQQDMLDAPQYFFSGDGRLAFLLVRPVKEAGSFTAALKSVSAARELVAGLQKQFPDLQIGLTGMPVLETDEMVAAGNDTRLASWLAIIGVSVLFLLVYRSVAYPLLTVVTLLTGTAWAMGWLTLTVGHLNILSATFAVMLIGMGDYGVLWVMRYEQARREGLSVRDALLHTTTHVAVGNLTAASTLALAFFAAMLADFQAVAELGWIAGCGVLLCALACFTVLPALLILFDRRDLSESDATPMILPLRWSAPVRSVNPKRLTEPSEADSDGRTPNEWLPWVGRWPGLVLGCGLMVAVVLGVCAGRVGYDHNLLHLQASNLDSVKWEQTLIAHTAGASWHAISMTDTPAEALALAARYRELPGVSRVVEVASLVPPDQNDKIPFLKEIQDALSALPHRQAPILHPRTDLDQLRGELTRLLGRVRNLEGRAGLPAGLGEGLQRLSADLDPAQVSEIVSRLCVFDQHLAESLAEKLYQLKDVSTPAPIEIAELPVSMRERYVGQTGRWLLRVFARDDLWDFGPLEHFTETIRAIDPEATGKPFGTVEGLKAMKGGLQRAGMYAFLVIVLVLWIDFRRPRDTLIALMPLLLGVLLSLGVLGVAGVPLNPANMIAFPLILGVGVDNGVHMLHDYLIRRREGLKGVSRAIGRGVLVKAMTTMIGFGTLMISTERGLGGLGLILTLGVGCSMLSALVLLPAALNLLTRLETARPDAVSVEPVRQAA